MKDHRSIHCYSRSDGSRLIMQCGDYSEMPERSCPYVDTRRAFWGQNPDIRCERCEAVLKAQETLV